jgi:sodium/bile acid cotransporter 7
LLLLLVVAAVHTGALAIGYFAARAVAIAPADAAAVGIAGSQKTLMVGLLIAALDPTFGIGILSLVVYHVLQLLIDTPAADWLRRRHASAAPTEDDTAAVT